MREEHEIQLTLQTLHLRPNEDPFIDRDEILRIKSWTPSFTQNDEIKFKWTIRLSEIWE